MWMHVRSAILHYLHRSPSINLREATRPRQDGRSRQRIGGRCPDKACRCRAGKFSDDGGKCSRDCGLSQASARASDPQALSAHQVERAKEGGHAKREKDEGKGETLLLLWRRYGRLRHLSLRCRLGPRRSEGEGGELKLAFQAYSPPRLGHTADFRAPDVFEPAVGNVSGVAIDVKPVTRRS